MRTSKKITLISKKQNKKDSANSNPLINETGKYNIPLINIHDPSRPLNDSELAKDSKSICLRPDIFLHNGRHCEGCKYYKICENDLKILPKHISFDGNKFISTEENKTKKKQIIKL